MISGDRRRWTVREVAADRLQTSGNRVFLTEVDGGSETYGTFIGRSATLGRFLQNTGIGSGDAVATLCPNGLPGLHAWLAVGLIGAVDVPLNPAYRGDLLRHVMDVAKPKAVLVDRELVSNLIAIRADLPFVRDVIVISGAGGKTLASDWNVTVHDYDEIVRDPAPALPEAHVRPSDIASIMFTSGTTGPQKGAMMPNGQVCLLALQSIQAMRMGPDEVFYCVHPMNHIAGKFMGVLATFATGGHVILDRRFEATAWLARIRAHRVTLSIAHGPMIEMIHATTPGPHDRDHAMRRLMCCPLPKQIAGAFEERFALRGVEMWGMTEVACPCWTALEGPRPPGSCGRVLTDWYDLKIVDPETDEELDTDCLGEIVVRPRYPWTVMQGYLGMPEATVETWRNFWFHTGDAGMIDEDGNVFFVDRIKDRIRRRAENISSYDIESAAAAYPGVREVAAVGVPSGYEGDDDIKLCIVPDRDVDPLAVLEFLAARLPHFMVPRYIESLEALPRTPTNKVRKRALREVGVTPATWDRQSAGVKLKDLYRAGDVG